MTHEIKVPVGNKIHVLTIMGHPKTSLEEMAINQDSVFDWRYSELVPIWRVPFEKMTPTLQDIMVRYVSGDAESARKDLRKHGFYTKNPNH